jgi:hypothetical protein
MKHVPSRTDFSALKMEVTCFAKISVDPQWTARRYIPADRTFLFLWEPEIQQDNYYHNGGRNSQMNIWYSCSMFWRSLLKIMVRGPFTRRDSSWFFSVLESNAWRLSQIRQILPNLLYSHTLSEYRFSVCVIQVIQSLKLTSKIIKINCI